MSYYMGYDVVAAASISSDYLNSLDIPVYKKHTSIDEEPEPTRMCSDPVCEQEFCYHTPSFGSLPYTPFPREEGEICELCWVIFDAISGENGVVHTKKLGCALEVYDSHILVVNELKRRKGRTFG